MTDENPQRSRVAEGSDGDDASSTIKFRFANGILVPLRTRAELQAQNETIDAYICEISVKDTAKAINAIKTIPGQRKIDLHHLRRVVKRDFLPEQLHGLGGEGPGENERQSNETPNPPAALGSAALPLSLANASSGAHGKSGRAVLSDIARQGDPGAKSEFAHILIAPTSLVSKEVLISLLQKHLGSHFGMSEHGSKLFTVPIPLHPPTTREHGIEQSRLYWPTTYNPNTAYGPNPADLASAQREIERNASTYLTLATEVATESSLCDQGESIGVVVVESARYSSNSIQADATQRLNLNATEAGPVERIVCVAGDARFHGRSSDDLRVNPPCDDGAKPDGNRCCNSASNKGDPAHHAVMRAIEFVAQKRRALAAAPLGSSPSPSNAGPTALEHQYLSADTLLPNGYLCLNLRFYITHEPCVMCSMALVHSRVGWVVFGRRMPKTGGLCADGAGGPVASAAGADGEAANVSGQATSLGYGLFWRPELNWRFFCWEFKGPDEAEILQENSRVGIGGKGSLAPERTVPNDSHV